MKTLTANLSRWFRSLAYILISFPILVILFCATMFGLSGGAFLPLAVLILMALLTLMEYVAKSEIARVNKILGTDFKVVPNWFSTRFFSWDGLKERVTSLRSWMAIGYIFLAFFWSVLALAVAIFGFAGALTLLVSLGLVAFAGFNQQFSFVNNDEVVKGYLLFDTPIFEFKIGDNMDSSTLEWSLQSWPAVLFGSTLILLAIWLIPRFARINARLVESLLSGTAMPNIEARFKRLFSKEKISERQVREAMQSEELRNELEDLSTREREILALMAQGKTNAGIAKILFITEGSVEKHISNILNKLGIDGIDDTHRRVTAVLKFLKINQPNQKID